MIAPWGMKAWELHRDPAAYNSLVLAAHSLASRFSETTQCLRSWDTCVTKRYAFTDLTKDFLLIIDNMLNLDLLFWAAQETENPRLYEVSIAHARTTQKHHVRTDHTTFHVVNLDPKTGSVQCKFTNQGYSDESCWARDQAWGILGFMQTFEWTHETSFLDTARALADRFLAELPADGVPYWDFAAPITESSPRDTSAAMIAACGFLLLYKALLRDSFDITQRYLHAAITLVDRTVTSYMNSLLHFEHAADMPTVPVFVEHPTHHTESQPGPQTLKSIENISEAILTGATINNYEFAPRRWSNHGLVYADYYFLLFGNMLMDLGINEATGAKSG